MTESINFTHFHNRKWLFVFSNQSKVLSKHILCSGKGKTFAFVFQTNVFLIIIKVFPFSKGKTFMYFVWFFIIIFLFRCDSTTVATYHFETLRQVSVWLRIENLLGTVKNYAWLRNYAPALKKHCSTEQARTITDIRILIGGMSLVTNRDVSSTKKSFREKCRGLRVFDLLSKTF